MALDPAASLLPVILTVPLTVKSALLSTNFTAPAFLPEVLFWILDPYISTLAPPATLTAAGTPSDDDVFAFVMLVFVPSVSVPPLSTSIIALLAGTF